jgi:hypothetical protein
MVGIAGAASDGSKDDDEALGDLVVGRDVYYIASGEKVIADAAVRDQIVNHHRKTRAIEMEGYGFSAAVWQSFEQRRHLVIKAICDRADRNKGEDWQQSDSRFRRDWFAESRSLWPWSVAHLFIWNSSQFGQPLPQLAIDWEDSSADAHFFLESTPPPEGTLQIGVGVVAKVAAKLYKGVFNGYVEAYAEARKYLEGKY